LFWERGAYGLCQNPSRWAPRYVSEDQDPFQHPAWLSLVLWILLVSFYMLFYMLSHHPGLKTRALSFPAGWLFLRSKVELRWWRTMLTDGFRATWHHVDPRSPLNSVCRHP
jgi:hypothetical protein